MRPEPRSLVAEALVVLVRTYQWTLRPFIGANCRFEPSCSHYAIEALRRHGPVHGTRLAGARVLRCNPWNAGGWDPCPIHGSWRTPTYRPSAPHADRQTDPM